MKQERTSQPFKENASHLDGFACNQAIRYHCLCEAFDRGVCTGIRYGDAYPETMWERRVVADHSKRQRRDCIITISDALQKLNRGQKTMADGCPLPFDWEAAEMFQIHLHGVSKKPFHMLISEYKRCFPDEFAWLSETSEYAALKSTA